jgi:transglutaminase-like putative cysteine protease
VRFDITYRTVFRYEELVRESQNELRACPTTDLDQQLIGYRVTTAPASRVLSYLDYWGTRVDAFGVRAPHLQLEVVAEASVETRPRSLLAATVPVGALLDPAFLDTHAELLQPSRHARWGHGIGEAAARAVDLAGDDVVSRVLAVHRLIGSRLTYRPGSTYVGVDVDDVFQQAEGVCQDFAHLGVAMCRSVGIPARYVSGYLFTVDDATGADATSDRVSVQTHAWFEAAVPGAGWLPLDPTNRQVVGERHVKIGHGRDYDDVPPVRGVYAGADGSEVDAMVEMRRMGAMATFATPAATVPPLPPPPVLASSIQQQHQQQQQ